MKQKITCHIIAGFSAAGKSSFIKALLTYKPEHEKWAVLVNESGNTQYQQADYVKDNIFIKEIYGGCLCCTKGIAFRVALNNLIKEASPQRIFIEPAGAGHLTNIAKLLQSRFYLPILEIKASICLLSEKQLADTKYAENDAYLSLIQQADKLCISGRSDNSQAKIMANRYSKPLYILQNSRCDLAFLEIP